MKSAKLRLGAKGERAARAFLVAAGYRILYENYSTPLGEIDLMQIIQRYNEVDCKVMMELVRYLRANH